VTAFYILAALMVLVAIAFVLWPLVRPSSGGRVERQAANLSIFRDQFADLEADLGRGTLSPDQHGEAKAERERRLLDEGRPETPAASSTTRPRVAAAVTLALALPLAFSLALFWEGYHSFCGQHFFL
jgi:cytochrome c-type biogenesis protein CcmH